LSARRARGHSERGARGRRARKRENKMEREREGERVAVRGTETDKQAGISAFGK
jgi:hypothetical protein